MKKTVKAFCISLVFFFTGQIVKAQVDPHFSLYYVYPSWLNPALTGVFDGDYRVAGIYRNQWGSISSPYSTSGVSADFSTSKNANFGVSMLNQTAGDGGYSYTTAYGNAAFTGLRFGPMESKRVVIAMQFGLIQRGFNRDKLTFGDQWNPVTGYNPASSSSDITSIKKSSSFDMGAGAFYYDAMPGKKINPFGGISFSHLTKPKDNFSKVGEATIPMRYTIHGGMRIKFSETFSLTPNVLYMKQGTSQEIMGGAYAQIKAAATTDFMAGVNYRVKDAIAPFVGFTHNNMMLGASYDINTSDLGNMSPGTSSFEISLSFVGRRITKTPETEFVCPRL